MNNPSGPILWGTAPVPKWQSLVRLCLRMRNYRYPDFPSKRSFWMENPPRPQPHNAPSGRKETVGRGKRTGNRRGRTAAGPTHLNRRGRVRGRTAAVPRKPYCRDRELMDTDMLPLHPASAISMNTFFSPMNRVWFNYEPTLGFEGENVEIDNTTTRLLVFWSSLS